MSKLPTTKKAFSDLLPRGKLRRRWRLLLGSTLGMLGLGAAGQPSPSPAQPIEIPVLVRNRDQRGSKQKLVLNLWGRDAPRFFAGHRSHSSHSSHSSHGSHSSHYSSSGGVQPVRPAPPPPSPPPSPPPAREPQSSQPSRGLVSTAPSPKPEPPPSWPEGFSFTDEGARKLVLKITQIELGKSYRESIVVGIDREGHTYTFHVLPETRLRRLTPEESVQTFRDILQTRNEAFPLVEGQEVLVAWKLYAQLSWKIIVQVTLY